MKRFVQGSLWLGLYVLLSLAPLFVVWFSTPPPGRDFLTELSVALGFVGLSMVGLQFVITARFQRATAPYGVDIILRFHREISVAAFVIILAHPILILIRDGSFQILNLPQQPPRVWFAVLSLLALTAIIVTSVWRQRLRISYEAWRVAHSILAISALGLALAHVIGVRYYIAMPWKQALWIGMAGMSVILLLYVRVFKPWRMLQHPYRLDEVKPELGRSWTLVFSPIGHEGIAFQAGQFAWITLCKSPFAIEEHPFSFSSSARRQGSFSVTIKELGDFTSTVGKAKVGSLAYVDGPYGAFVMENHEAPGFVFIAGGAGITPIMSMLRTLADYEDPRPLLLVYGSKDWESITFRDELTELAEHLVNLQIVHVLEAPPEDWEHEVGYVTSELLERYLPEDLDRRHYFLCGPVPMLINVERALAAVNVPQSRIHAELFNLV